MDRTGQFLKLFLAHEAEVRAFIGALVRERVAREDVFQDVAVALWEGFDRYDPARPFGAWARGVASNKILQQRRRDARSPIAFSPETIEAVRDAFDRTDVPAGEREEALEECLRRLPERSAEILSLRYSHGASAASDRLAIAHLSRCRLSNAEPAPHPVGGVCAPANHFEPGPARVVMENEATLHDYLNGALPSEALEPLDKALSASSALSDELADLSRIEVLLTRHYGGSRSSEEVTARLFAAAPTSPARMGRIVAVAVIALCGAVLAVVFWPRSKRPVTGLPTSTAN